MQIRIPVENYPLVLNKTEGSRNKWGGGLRLEITALEWEQICTPNLHVY